MKNQGAARVTLSCGNAELDWYESDKMLFAHDMALYQAKDDERNKVYSVTRCTKTSWVARKRHQTQLSIAQGTPWPARSIGASANAFRNMAIRILTGISLMIFILFDLVQWRVELVLAFAKGLQRILPTTYLNRCCAGPCSS